MKVIRNRLAPLQLQEPVFATLGNFDGVHLGHQSLIKEIVKQKDQRGVGSAVVISFYPHPAVVLGKAQDIGLLTPLRRKVVVLDKLGIDVFAPLHFTQEMSRLSAAEFVSEILFNRFRISSLVIGPDARVGRDRQGTPEVLSELVAKGGGEVKVLDVKEYAGLKISSRAIREALINSKLDLARDLLGRNYVLEGRVQHGAGRGKTIGIPTANLSLGKQLVPGNGVYVARVTVPSLEGQQSEDCVYGAVVNIGVRPTFGGSQTTVEAHLMNFGSENLYGMRISVELISKIRDERKFEDVKTLVSQIHEDIEMARKRLGV